MLIVGLTGSIATGKSTVARMLAELGAEIVDADRIAHDVVIKGKPAWQKIVDRFGKDILLPDGQIDREKLGNIVFNDAAAKQELNRITHPHVFQEMAAEMEAAGKRSPHALVVLDVPLLFEARMESMVSEVIVIYVPEDIQIKRLVERNGYAEKDALARIRSQMSIEEKKKRAGRVIDNQGSLENTRRQVEELYRELKERITGDHAGSSLQ